ncbi:MAG: PilW family protein [Giesbergeria sp.]|nr:PilW family protein [Giesbergeria sp.]MBP9783806.1 PilW family protein [Giesbergeria sp.]MBP9894827.1 PilW family protein [Giesbergeria sp.]
MISRTTIALACGSNRWGKYPRTASVALARSQRGVTLIELMIGIAIGLLTIAVAMGSLMVSRGVSGTVSDASSIQQQGAFAMRTIGLQLRQTGSLRLNLNPGIVTAAEPYLAPAAFETKAGQFDPTTPTGILEGKDSPGATEFKLDVRYSSYTEPLFVGGTQSQARDCLGANPDPNLLESKFSLRVNPVTNVPELVCASAGSIAAQPLVQNVANFQVRYLLQDNTSTPGSSTLKSVDAAGVGVDWAKVQGVDVCLVLYGTERIDLPTGSNYTDCDGAAVDMSTLTGARARRMHVTFRNTFQLRSQGLIGSVL